MQIYKKILILISTAILLTISKPVYAYTVDEVEKHNKPNDCLVIFENRVYDLTEYLTQHDRYMDIREWCGKDMTEDFKTKDDLGVDHKRSSYALLEQYLVGELEKKPEDNTVKSNIAEVKQNVTTQPKEYNLVLPILLTTISYWGMYLLVKRNILGRFNIIKFNAFWNTLLILLLLIPSFGFGVFMILRIQYPELYSTTSNILYLHVQLSLVMGSIAVSHFIQRFVMYTKQILPSK